MITDLRVDDALPEMRAEVERHETHTPEHREALQRFVTVQRHVRNTAEGYWVAAASPEAAAHALTGATPLGDARAAGVMSDGVSRLVTEYGMATWSEAFATLRTGGPRELIDRYARWKRRTPLDVGGRATSLGMTQRLPSVNGDFTQREVHDVLMS